MRRQQGLGSLADHVQGLLFRNRWEVLQEFLKRLAGPDVVEQRLDEDAGTGEDRLP